MTKRLDQGFSAVELLITLFVAAAFIVAGYQLYNVVVKDGGQARADVRAANVAYDYLRRYEPVVTDPCVAATPLNNSSIMVAGLSNVRITIGISCPYASTSGLNNTRSISKITATLQYNNGDSSTFTTYVHRADP